MANKRIHSVRLTDRVEMMAVMHGEIAGEVYSDGQVYAEVPSLTTFRERTAETVTHHAV